MFIQRKYNHCSSGNCHCERRNSNSKYLQGKNAVKTIPSALLSFLIAFFPKCPLCWTVYMSMFSSVGMAKLPYMKWLLPFLFVLLALYLIMLYRNSARVGLMPLIISGFGSIVLWFARTTFTDAKWMLMLGIGSIIFGALLNALLSAKTIQT